MWLITLRSVHSPYLHGHWLYLHRNAILSPSFPAYVWGVGLILIWRGTVEVCTPTLVKPPACAILVGTTTLYSLSIKCTSWITTVIINIWCAEGCRLLIFLLVIPTECIACLNASMKKQNKTCNEVHYYWTQYLKCVVYRFGFGTSEHCFTCTSSISPKMNSEEGGLIFNPEFVIRGIWGGVILWY